VPGSMPVTCPELSEEELQAYVDGHLPAERAAAVEARLAADPEAAARVAAYSRQRDDLAALAEALLAGTGASGPVAALERALRGAVRRQRRLDRTIAA
jgi:anti-sigma factor RsiW